MNNCSFERFKEYIAGIDSLEVLYSMRRNFINEFICYESTIPQYDPHWGNILWEAQYVPRLKYFCIDYCWDMVDAIDVRILRLGGVIDYTFRRYMNRAYSVGSDEIGFHKDVPF